MKNSVENLFEPNENPFEHNRLCNLLGVRYPIIQAGMVWVSGGKLAAAAANAGCLGVIGAGSMSLDLLRHHIRKARLLTNKPIAINTPLLYHGIQEQLELALEEGVRIFITSAGSPKVWTPFLHSHGATVLHVASTPLLAHKCQDAGVDAVVVEGFEAGGHNGRDELTTLVLLQQLRNKLTVPVVAAGGIGSGAALAAALLLGADGAQIGTLFAATQESSAHPNFKAALVDCGSTDTMLLLKKHVPVRLLKNAFSESIVNLEAQGASREQLTEMLGKGRAKKGMLEGDLAEGELEIGQIASEIKNIETCEALVASLLNDFAQSKKTFCS